ncbi:hypothetical protein FVEN_g1197 [Fusarium venenatum]|uniref:CBM-cenC domain-containing protein n=1 Tax=Fusarium venenatum TaxID=56646 RepID=A0A2L2TH34_9HYPO|nr:uncharacterized protein FVRRES_10359 [Fusarium venenatum]KAG8361551.1 hypothetical protein FVEN_g1197 [Fusarium venenatum]KAH6966972.1 hypothetical protein EDB82DRAFT_580502 [Fusarium venenatum]CEI70282.1 unnamed protein product [Fusarium venenatum]
MIAKTFVIAFIAASFIAGSQASPCKASSKTTDILTTVGLTTAEIAVLTTEVSSVEDITLTISQTETSTEPSAISEVTPIAVTTTALSSSIIESSIETSTVPEDITTTAVPTTTAEGTTTAEATTTTEVAVVTSFLTNGGFDDKKDTTQPWRNLNSEFVDFTIDNNIKHDERNSARLSFKSAVSGYIAQRLGAPITAGIPYSISAWVRPGTGCTRATLACNSEYATVEVQGFDLASTINQWKQFSITCTWTQDEINDGGLDLIFAFTCGEGSDGWVDTIAFSES